MYDIYITLSNVLRRNIQIVETVAYLDLYNTSITFRTMIKINLFSSLPNTFWYYSRILCIPHCAIFVFSLLF